MDPVKSWRTLDLDLTEPGHCRTTLLFLNKCLSQYSGEAFVVLGWIVDQIVYNLFQLIGPNNFPSSSLHSN